MSRTVDPPALIPGCHLYEGSDGVWRYYRPGDEFVRVTAPTLLLSAARRQLHGHGLTGPMEPGVEALVEALAARGVVQPSPMPSMPPRATVLVLGDGPIAEHLSGLLHHDVVTGPADATAVAHADVVVSCAGWLPDAAWQQLDQACIAHQVPWHGCYAEGTRWYVGPMAVPGRTAGYADTRARRLGACGVPEELLAYWAYLDTGVELPPVPWPGSGAAAVIAGLIGADVEAFLASGNPAAPGRQLEVDPETLAVVSHPVLPLPRTAGDDR